MKKIILPTLLLLLSLLCLKPVFSKKIFSRNAEVYQASKSRIDSVKISCKKLHVQQTGIIFSRYIDQHLFPYWIGTPWDFNGTTEIPRQGFIACGYFVTTVLRDAGVKLQRVKLAQLASEQMIQSLTKQIEHYGTCSFADFIQKVKAKGIGLSIIGLDNHTGFLYYDGKELYFIHSSYVGTAAVAKEIAANNDILKN
jgi:hypothetical protein